MRLGRFYGEKNSDCRTEGDKQQFCNPYVEDIGIESITAHGRFGIPPSNTSDTNNIALLKLKRAVNYTSK